MSIKTAPSIFRPTHRLPRTARFGPLFLKQMHDSVFGHSAPTHTTLFRSVTPCSLEEVYSHFTGFYRLYPDSADFCQTTRCHIPPSRSWETHYRSVPSHFFWQSASRFTGKSVTRHDMNQCWFPVKTAIRHLAARKAENTLRSGTNTCLWTTLCATE